MKKKTAMLLSVVMCILAIVITPDTIIDETSTSQVVSYVCIVSESPTESSNNNENSTEYGVIDKPKFPNIPPIFLICGCGSKTSNNITDYIKSIFKDSFKDLFKDWIKRYIKNYLNDDSTDTTKQKDAKPYKVKLKKKKKNDRR